MSNGNLMTFYDFPITFVQSNGFVVIKDPIVLQNKRTGKWTPIAPREDLDDFTSSDFKAENLLTTNPLTTIDRQLEIIYELSKAKEINFLKAWGIEPEKYKNDDLRAQTFNTIFNFQRFFTNATRSTQHTEGTVAQLKDYEIFVLSVEQGLNAAISKGQFFQEDEDFEQWLTDVGANYIRDELITQFGSATQLSYLDIILSNNDDLASLIKGLWGTSYLRKHANYRGKRGSNVRLKRKGSGTSRDQNKFFGQLQGSVVEPLFAGTVVEAIMEHFPGAANVKGGISGAQTVKHYKLHKTVTFKEKTKKVHSILATVPYPVQGKPDSIIEYEIPDFDGSLLKGKFYVSNKFRAWGATWGSSQINFDDSGNILTQIPRLENIARDVQELIFFYAINTARGAIFDNNDTIKINLQKIIQYLSYDLMFDEPLDIAKESKGNNIMLFTVNAGVVPLSSILGRLIIAVQNAEKSKNNIINVKLKYKGKESVESAWVKYRNQVRMKNGFKTLMWANLIRTDIAEDTSFSTNLSMLEFQKILDYNLILTGK